mmetsp:Transcript_30706/g.51689  ORF Transcript_30706/g.51689 Transcript_30706/m.51689 type:complete len:247 (+) Transcript_30706:284-1024(+)
MQTRLSILGEGIGVSASLEKGLGEFGLAFVTGTMERGFAGEVGAVDIAALLDDATDEFALLFGISLWGLDQIVKGGVSVSVPHVDIDLGHLEELLAEVKVSLRAGTVQDSPAVGAVLHVDVKLLSVLDVDQKGLDGFVLVFEDGVLEGHVVDSSGLFFVGVAPLFDGGLVFVLETDELSDDEARDRDDVADTGAVFGSGVIRVLETFHLTEIVNVLEGVFDPLAQRWILHLHHVQHLLELDLEFLG